MKMGYFVHIITHITLHVGREARRQAQPGQTKNDVDGDYNRVFRIWQAQDRNYWWTSDAFKKYIRIA